MGRSSAAAAVSAGEGELLLAELDRPLTDGEDSRHDGKSVYRLSLAGEACREKPGPNGETAAETATVMPSFSPGSFSHRSSST